MTSESRQKGQPLARTETREAQGTGDVFENGPLAVRTINADGDKAGHGRTQATTYYDANGQVQATTVQNTDGNQTATLSPDATDLAIKLSNGQLQLAGVASLAATDVVVGTAGETVKSFGRWLVTTGAKGLGTAVGIGLGAAVSAGVAVITGLLLLTGSAGPTDTIQYVGDGRRFRLVSNAATGITRVEALTDGTWARSGVFGIAVDGGVQFDPGSLATPIGQEFAKTIPAQPKAVDTDVTLPAAFDGARNVRQYDLDGFIPAGTLGPQADGTIGVLTYAYRGQHWSKGGQAVPVVGQLSKATVDAICSAYDAVQNLTTSTYYNVAAKSGMSPQQIGTETHRLIELAVRGWPPTSFAIFSSNVGLLSQPSQPQSQQIQGARVAGSSWLDVLQDNGNNTVCVYDIKTGNATLGNRQASRYLSEVRKFRRYATEIIVIEVKP
jgi:hypothetical protein